MTEDARGDGSGASSDTWVEATFNSEGVSLSVYEEGEVGPTVVEETWQTWAELADDPESIEPGAFDAIEGSVTVDL